jgi:HEAT repeats
MVRCRHAFAVLTVLAAGCAASSAEVRDAAAGHLAGLDARVAAQADHCTLGRGEALELARATLAGDIGRARGKLGVDDIRRLGACVRPLRSALAKRADTKDEVGAEAAMALVEAGVSGPGSFDAGVGYPIGAWRALSARGLTGSGDGTERRAKMVDPDQDVRLAAMRAAARAEDEEDADLLLEAARVDPYPLARAQAARAVGAVGGERVVLALKDLWAQADEPVRMAIADAWAMPRSADAGGRRELGWAADAARGSAQIAAASGLVRAGGPESAQGVAVLEQAITTGTAKDRIFAIMVAPSKEESIKAALKKASDDADEVVAVAALARRLESAPPRADASAIVAKLMKLAFGDSRGAIAAKTALARAGQGAVLPIVARDAHAQDPKLREAGGIALALLHDYPHAAVVAVDQDRDVRTHVACAMLTAER